MEKKTRKPRKTPVWDPIHKLAGQYLRKIRAAHKEIDDLARKGHNGKVATPNYAKEVIEPLAKVIDEQLPALGITVSDKVERVSPKEAYFLMRAGEQTLGGFSYPGPSANHINFTVFAHDKPWGRVIQVARQAQLLKVVGELADFLGINQDTASDERQ